MLKKIEDLPIELWDVEKLIPYTKNAKKHSKEQVGLLAASIVKHGLANPPHIKPSGEIITGHGRVLAWKSLERTTIPVFVRHDLTNGEADALRIADNKTASNEWDMELLQEDAQRLNLEGHELTDMGFEEIEIEKMSASLGEINTDVFVEDVSEAVETQKTENKEKEAEIDSASAPIGDAFGFKRLTIEQSRKVRDFMGKIETATGKTGSEALIAYIEGVA